MTIKEYRKELRAFLDENNIEYQTTDNTSYLFRTAKKFADENEKSFTYSEYKRIQDIEFDEPEPKIITDDTTNITIEGNAEPESEEAGDRETKINESEQKIETPVERTEKTLIIPEIKPKKDNAIWYVLGGLAIVIAYMVLTNLNKNNGTE